jgi:F420-0:gamma-glutamyl ligase-like protein
MQADLIVEQLQAQAGKDVVLRVAGQKHAIRGISEAGTVVIIEAGEVLTAGAAVAPQEALREAEQITPDSGTPGDGT